jgi:hypothetical protein
MNAYLPDLVERSVGFVVDRPAQNTIHGKPLRALADIRPPANFLLAIHPRSLEAVRANLTQLGHNAKLLDWRPEKL